MRTNKSDKLADLVSSLSVLGLIGNDAYRLAKRIREGANDKSIESFANMVHNACRETIEQQDFLIRVSGMDLVIYTKSGYAVIDYTAGWSDFAFPYREGQNFQEMTKLYRSEELDLSAA
jgi:hypothetical protein